MSWLRRLFAGRRPTEPPALVAPPTPEPSLLGPPELEWLDALARAIRDGQRHSEVGGETFFARLQALWTAGHEALALEWLTKFVGMTNVPAACVPPLQRRLAEWRLARSEWALAMPWLDALTAQPGDRAWAHARLGEAAQRKADASTALRHYERVLAIDVDFPNVRARVERLRQELGLVQIAPGETLVGPRGAASQGRYQLVRELGRGGSGIVYHAHDRELGREVAVKLLHALATGPAASEALARFFHEARAMAALRHPNVVAILDLDVDARRIVMELAEGGTLRQVLAQGPLSPRRALERHVQLMAALVAAHRRDIVHLDVKPANLMFRRPPDEPGAEIMLGDFGIAHLPERDGRAPRTTPNPLPAPHAAGTWAYMAPEQRRGEPCAASDLFAAGVVLIEMLVGEPAPAHPHWADAQAAHETRQANALTRLAPGPTRDALGQHVAHLMALMPTARPTSEVALAEAIALRGQLLVAPSP